MMEIMDSEQLNDAAREHDETADAPERLLPTGIDVWFQETLHARGDALKRFVDGFIKFCEFHEKHTSKRKRKRRSEDQKTFEAAAEAVICNLALMALQQKKSGEIAIDLHKGGKRSRYRSSLSVKVLTQVIDFLAEGHVAPDGDMYDLSGHWHEYRRDKHREAIKTTMSAMWFKGWPKSFPKGGRKGLPRKLKVDTILEAIKGKHPLIVPILGQILGYQLAFKESEVLLRILTKLNGEGILALPLHDAIMVPQSKALIAEHTMSQVTQEMCGFPFPVSMENIEKNTLALVETLLADHGQRPLDL